MNSSPCPMATTMMFLGHRGNEFLLRATSSKLQSWYFINGSCTGASCGIARIWLRLKVRSEEHTSELQSLMRISYAVFCLKKKKKHESITELAQQQLITSNTTHQ